jgi:hypothetical protein
MQTHILGETVTYKAFGIPFTQKDFYTFKWIFDYHDILYGYKIKYIWKNLGTRKIVLEVTNNATGIKTINISYTNILTRLHEEYIAPPPIITYYLLTEDGKILTTESGNRLTFINDIPPVTTFRILSESGNTLLSESGNTLILE